MCSAGRWTKQARSVFSTSSSTPDSISSIPPTSIAASFPGMSAENLKPHRQVAGAAGQPQSRRHRHQGRNADGSEPGRFVESLHLPGGRGLVAAAADGLHRSLSVALRRCRHPLAETLQAYAELIRQGKVRAIGASNYGAARLTEPGCRRMSGRMVRQAGSCAGRTR